MREQYGGSALGSRTSEPGDIGSSPAAAASGNDNDHDHGHDGPDEGEIQQINAGVFLTGVEDVVQPYSLPRPVHVVFSSPPPQNTTDDLVSPSPAPLTASQAPTGPAAAVPGTLLVSANDDADVVEDSETDNMSTSGLEGAYSQTHQRARRIPKSMAALAAEAAEAQARATAVAADDVAVTAQMTEEEHGGEDSARARISRTATHKTSTRTRTRTNTNTNTTTRSKTETQIRTRAETETGETMTETKSRTRADLGTTPSRKRARTQDDDGGDDGGASASGWKSGSDREAREEHASGRGPKRARKHRHDGEAPVPVPASDRVLRTRKGKSPARLAQERDQELAVQRALAG